MRLLKVLFLSSCLSLILNSCSKEFDSKKNEPVDPSEPLIEFLINSGFNLSDIKNVGTHYLVEEDILFSKKMTIPKQVTSENGRTSQYFTNLLISRANQSNIRIFIDPSLTSMTSEVTSAIAQWNQILPSNIRFVMVQGSPYEILVRNTNLGDGFCGMAEFANNGLPGSLIDINASYISGNSFDQRQRTITHELGHAIGFRHTNWSGREPKIGVINGISYDAIDVPLVGGTDANSLMNGGQCGSGATALSEMDKGATRVLYPRSVYINSSSYFVSNINTLNGFNWPTSNNTNGTIRAWPGTLVKVIVSAYTPAGTNLYINFGISGAVLTGNAGSSIIAYNNSVSGTFTMSTSGFVSWEATFAGATTGVGSIGVELQ
jgi:hypothetical protein